MRGAKRSSSSYQGGDQPVQTTSGKGKAPGKKSPGEKWAYLTGLTKRKILLSGILYSFQRMWKENYEIKKLK